MTLHLNRLGYSFPELFQRRCRQWQQDLLLLVPRPMKFQLGCLRPDQPSIFVYTQISDYILTLLLGFFSVLTFFGADLFFTFFFSSKNEVDLLFDLAIKSPK